MAKLTLNNVANGGPTGVASINVNNDLIETALENTLSRDGTSPNQMNSDFDMNNNDILNVKSIDVDVLYINGESVAPSTLSSLAENSVGTVNIIDGAVTETKIADEAVTEPKLADGLANVLTYAVADRTALKALDTSRYKVASLIEAGRSGTFDQVSYATYSALVTADTAEAIIVRSTQDDTKAWLRRDHYELNVMWAGATQASSEATNRAALEATIALVDALGYGKVLVPGGINYGYVRTDVTTHPDHIALDLGVTVDFVTVDYGVGSTYTAPSKDGAQVRYFSYNVQTSPAGLHDGNVLRWGGSWHPAVLLDNTHDLAAVGDPSRTADDNRRASIVLANDGVTTWRIGQGINAGAGLTDDELSTFLIGVNGVPDLSLSGLTGVLEIKKTNLQVDWYPTNFGVHFRNNAATKLADLHAGEATDVRLQVRNSVNTARLDVGTGSTDTDAGLAFIINGSNRLRILRNGNIYPGADNAQSLGATNARMTTIYATTGTINTSDLLLKTGITDEILDAVFRAVRRVRIVQYQWKDAVAEKGADGARLHFGVIAQEVGEAFEAEGLDPHRFGLFCYDEWEDEFDAEGNLTIEAGSRYGVRYDELLALMVAAERKRTDDIERRLAALEG